ncbi:PDZ and LIM domain protein Zasp-like [Pollicipes pollicipes]|uniref:PDZ and LIM domain protein Zasp-like n=1 Tax=Pollicipes pollicipes TaxID=41117 RepID=UPI0018858C2D|nr:PDZ and LIM domain protein Zasp-like [Pollicipes pollicipes]
MRHKEAQDSIVRSGNNISMVVQRGGLASLRLPPSATSVPKNLETTDGSVKALVHNQFNSPMPLYSEEKIAETLSAQTEVLAGGALGVNFKRYEPQPWKPAASEVYKMIHGDDADSGPGQSQDRSRRPRPRRPQHPCPLRPPAPPPTHTIPSRGSSLSMLVTLKRPLATQPLQREVLS